MTVPTSDDVSLSFIHSLVHSSFTYPFTHSFIYQFIHPFILSFLVCLDRPGTAEICGSVRHAAGKRAGESADEDPSASAPSRREVMGECLPIPSRGIIPSSIHGMMIVFGWMKGWTGGTPPELREHPVSGRPGRSQDTHPRNSLSMVSPSSPPSPLFRSLNCRVFALPHPPPVSQCGDLSSEGTHLRCPSPSPPSASRNHDQRRISGG